MNLNTYYSFRPAMMITVASTLLAAVQAYAEEPTVPDAAAAPAEVPAQTNLPDPDAVAVASALPTGVVAQIEGVAIPYDWFLHEFRSAYFRYGEQEDVRRRVFDSFLKRSSLYALAKKEGLLDDPRLRTQIDERVKQVRALMEYQLAMIEVNLGIQAYLTLMGITPETFTISDVELGNAILPDWEKRAGRTVTLEDIPEPVKEQMRLRLQDERFEAAVDEHLSLLKETIEVEVNDELVDSVPLPVIANGPVPVSPPRE